MSDGAALFLCNGSEADRTGKVYPDGLDPDVKIEGLGIRPTEDRDETIRAAEEWLIEQAATPASASWEDAMGIQRFFPPERF